MSGLLDTSVFVARETGRPLGPLPDEAAISVVTLAELHLGVLMADDAVRSRRLATLAHVERMFDPIPVDDAVARAFASLVADARRAGRRPGALDALIAATAVAHDLDLYTQDADFEGLPGVRVIRT